MACFRPGSLLVEGAADGSAEFVFPLRFAVGACARAWSVPARYSSARVWTSRAVSFTTRISTTARNSKTTGGWARVCTERVIATFSDVRGFDAEPVHHKLQQKQRPPRCITTSSTTSTGGRVCVKSVKAPHDNWGAHVVFSVKLKSSLLHPSFCMFCRVAVTAASGHVIKPCASCMRGCSLPVTCCAAGRRFKFI